MYRIRYNAATSKEWLDIKSDAGPRHPRKTKPLKRSPREARKRPREPANSLALYQLSSPDSKLSLQVARVFVDLQPCHAWFLHVPAYIGSDPAIDAVAKALVSATDHHFLPHDTTKGQQYITHHSSALRTLRTRLATDDASLLSIALLLFIEGVLGAELPKLYAHMQGMRAILEEQAKAGSLSDLGIRLLLAVVDVYFQTAIAFGEAPLWDDGSYMIPASPRDDPTRPPGFTMLERVLYPLTIRLTTLAAQVRKMRKTPDARYADVQFRDAITLAVELLELEDREAESEMLHEVKIVPTTDPAKRVIMPFSYNFMDSDQITTALHYWYLRLITVKLALLLLDAINDGTVNATVTGEHPANLDSVYLKVEQSRIAANIVECWQPTFSIRIRRKCLQITLIVLWGALADMAIFRDGTPVARVQSWVSQIFKDLLEENPLAAALMMDQASPSIGVGPLEDLLSLGIEARSDHAPAGHLGRRCLLPLAE